ncbi:Rab family GTPase [Candidatus Lokiarchaeum ossiferum]|uniref:Rab family GTPase n=1 Tax=Candidatus Lokiarchaeum ossiferum TaxID=2951803 RepID=UPI00352C0836
MLKNVTIIGEKKSVYSKDIAFSFITPDFLSNFMININEEMTARKYFNQETVLDLLSVKIICYKILEPFPLFFALTYDDSIVPEKFYPTLHSVIEKTLDFLKDKKPEILQKEPTAFKKPFEKLVDFAMENRPPKISILGYNGVGKTSICNYIEGIKPEKLLPTMNIERHSFRLFNIPIILWDFSDEIPENMVQKFLLGSDAVIIVLDSTKKNAKDSLHLLNLTKKTVPHAELIIVGNKQDQKKAESIEKLEKLMNHRIIPFNATNFANARLIQEQTAELLEICCEELDYTDESYVVQRND